ncbi:hypothetical protein DXG01_006357 [Tephrocybe rancida]|nr:hypothetical protein DXG01_006357 [Tephrocybe rancida]
MVKTSIIRTSIGLNNVAPRGNIERLSQKKVDTKLAARAARWEAAHMNGNEIFPLWAIAILVGNYAGIENAKLNILSSSFIALRILFNFIYANQSSQLQGFFRSLVWAIGASLPLYILTMSANAVRLRQ